MNLLNVNANLYKYFIAVYEHRHIRRASEKFLLSPSAISQNLSSLARQLGVSKLFTQTPKGVMPTAEAVSLYPIISRMYNLMLKAEQSVKTFDENSEAIIRLDMPPAACSVIGEVFKEFKKKYSNISFQVINDESIELLRQNKTDLFICTERNLNAQDLSTISLFDYECVFIANKSYITNTLMNVNELIKYPVIGHKEPLDTLTREIGIEFTPFIEMPECEPIYSLVKKSTGIGYCYSIVFDEHNSDNIVKLEIEGLPTFRSKFVCAYNNRNATLATKAFIQFLQEFCSTHLSAV